MKRLAFAAALALTLLMQPALLARAFDDAAEQPAPGTITGRVLNASSGAPVDHYFVYAWNQAGGYSSALTNASGDYTITIGAGSYAVYAWGANGYLTQIYPNINCTSCNITSGTPVAVTAGNTTANIDFNLVLGGRVAGYVFNDFREPMPGVEVQIFNSNGDYVTTGYSDSEGFYLGNAGLTTGTYFARTYQISAFIDEVYGGNLCFADYCDVAAIGYPISVAVGFTSYADFFLDPGGQFSGRVVDEPDTTRSLNDNFDGNDFSNRWTTDATWNGYIWEYDGRIFLENHTGVSRATASSTCVAHGNFDVVIDLDLALWNFGSTAFLSLSDIGGRTGIYRSAGVWQFDAYAFYIQGQLLSLYYDYEDTSAPRKLRLRRVGSELEAYYLNSFGYNFMGSWPAPTSDTGFTIGMVSDDSFTIDNVAYMDNFLVSADGVACGLSGVEVDVRSQDNGYIRSVYTGSDGRYISNGLPDGDYGVNTLNWLGFIDETYDNIYCVNCYNVGSLFHVYVDENTENISFQLDRGAVLTGLITDAVTGAPVSGAYVNVYDSDNTSMVYGYADASGVYTTRALPSGRYYAVAGGYGYLSELYDGRPCDPSCFPNAGNPIDAERPDPFTADFSITPIGTISGNVAGRCISPVCFSFPLSGATVQVFNSAGVMVQSATTDAGGNYSITGLTGGTYHARTVNNSGLIDQLYSGMMCLLNCDPLSGTPIAIGAGTNVTANFLLSPGARLSGRVTVEASGAASGFTYITVYDSSNVAVASGTADFNGDYFTSAFPPGTVFAITSSPWPFVNEAWNNINCPACVPNTTTAINAPTGVTSGINFTLIPGGYISGTVSSGGGGVPGVSIYFYNSAGVQVLSALTAPGSGFYLTGSRLPPGSYFIQTSGAPGGLVDELYNNIPCDPSCAVTAGTPVSAVADFETTNIDFQLAALGNVAGTVTNAVTTVGISGIEVRLFNSSGVLHGSTTTNGTGTYSFTGLTPGTYYARTYNTAAFFDEIYNDLPCPTNCVVTTGTGIVVVAGGTPTVNFALAPGARISGAVTADGVGVLSGVGVKIYDGLGQLVQTATTDGAGNYLTTQPMPSGTYYAVTANSAGYIDELYGGAQWDGALPGSSPISATAGATTPNVNFALGLGGRISGTVTRVAGGAPVVGASVDIYDASGAFRTTGVTNGAGYYISQAGLPAGSYFAKTSGTTGLVNERFDNTPCLGCSPSLGTPIPVVGAATTELIDFDLAVGATIQGAVTDNADTTALANVTVTLWDSTGHTVGTTATTGLGGYSFTGLPAGSYFVNTDNALGYINEAYNNVSCNNCIPATAGTAIAVGAGGTTTANIALTRGGRISGRVTSSSGGAGVPNVVVLVYSASGAAETSAVTDATGNYISRAGLAAGNYHLRTVNLAGFVDELYNNITCMSCTNVTSGAAVAVTLGTTTPSINFVLDPGGRISGTVTDLSNGIPIGGATVLIYNAAGVAVSSGLAAASGSYTTGAGLTSGTYYARTINTRGYIDRRYNNVTCLNPCSSVTSGTPIVVTQGSTTGSIHFTLALGGRISGRVTDDPVTTTFGGVGVNIYSLSGTFVSSTTADANGEYITSGLPATGYFARTANALGYIEELYDGLTCFGCMITAGTPIPVAVGTTAANRNFSLGVLGGRVGGRVTSSVNGAGIPNVEVRLFNDTGLVSVLTDTNGNYVTPAVPAGTWYEIAAPSSGYDTRLYDNILCAGCDLSTGTPISVVVGAVAGNRNFVLQPLLPTITLSSYAYEGSGHTVTATIQNAPGHRYDWVAFYPVNNSNTGFIEGPKYLNGLSTPPAVGLNTAQVTFSVPTSPGLYHVRLISALNQPLAQSGSISVTSQPTVALSRTNVPAGGSVVAAIANGPAYRYDYVGFYPIGNSNTGYVEFKYLNGLQTPPAAGMANANVTFITPSNLPLGQYNVRLIATSGITASSPTLTVTAPPTVTLSSTTIAAGSSVTATIGNAPGSSRFDYVGFYPINNGPTGFLSIKYLNNSSTAPAAPMTTGEVTLTTLSTLTPGQYNLRFMAAAGNQLAASVALTVTGPPSLTLTPSTVVPGASFTATAANGPGHRYDWVGFYPMGNGISGFTSYQYLNGTMTAPASGMSGASLPLTAPTFPGQYLMRFVSASTGAELANAILTVSNPPAVSVSTTAAISGSTVTATAAYGPNNRFSWVGLFPIANSNTGFVDWKYLNGAQTAPASAVTGSADLFFTMPATPGQYHVRFFNNLSVVIATSATITVTNTSAIALSGTSVVPGATVTATISGGPGNRYNWAGLFPITNGNTGYVGATQYLNGLSTPPASGMTGGALTFTMPATPGQYNIRFFPHDSSTPLRISGTITVAAAPTLVPSSTTVTAGTTITATAAGGPGARWDWVGLFPIANSNTGFINMRYLNDSQTAPAVGTTGGTVNFPAPLTPGQYNLRFFYTYGGSTPIATSVTVTVVP